MTIKQEPDPYNLEGSLIVTESGSSIFIIDGRQPQDAHSFSGTQIYVSDQGGINRSSRNWAKEGTRPLKKGESVTLEVY